MFIKGHISGIYKIVCLSTGKIYIGSSVNIHDRWSVHKHNLRKNKHVNKHLQQAWIKYGENNFQFEIIENTNPNFLIERENSWIDKTQARDRKYGFNIIEPAIPPMLGRLHTTKSKLKMSISGKSKTFTDEHRKNLGLSHIGSKRSQETKLKMSLASRGKKRSKKAVENNRKAQIGLRLGSKNPKAFLTENIVKEIRSDYENYKRKVCDGVRFRTRDAREIILKILMQKYNLKRCHLEKIIYNRIWRHI